MAPHYTIRNVLDMVDSGDMDGLCVFLDLSVDRLSCRMALARAIGNGNIDIIKMFYDTYPTVYFATDLNLSDAIRYGNKETAMYIISRGPPLTDSSMLYEALEARMYDVLDILIDSGLMDEMADDWDNHVIDTPKYARYYVRIGGWHDELNPKDYLFEISERTHGHIPSLREFLDAKSARVYDYSTDINVICRG